MTTTNVWNQFRAESIAWRPKEQHIPLFIANISETSTIFDWPFHACLFKRFANFTARWANILQARKSSSMEHWCSIVVSSSISRTHCICTTSYISSMFRKFDSKLLLIFDIFDHIWSIHSVSNCCPAVFVQHILGTSSLLDLIRMKYFA